MLVKIADDLQQPIEAEPVRRSWRYWPPLALLGTGIVLTAFAFWSHTVKLHSNRFVYPPIYGHFWPVVSRLAWWLVPAGLLLGTVGWFVTSARRVPTWLALTLTVAAGCLTSMAVNLVRGDRRALFEGVSTDPHAPYYTRDLHFVSEYGVRGFVEHYPTLINQLGSYNAKTHPPGVDAFLWTIYKLTGDHPFRFATVLALISLCLAVGAWALGRAYGGERAGRIAAVLAVAAPGPLLLAYTNMDVIFAAFFSISAALLVVGARRRSLALAAAGGAVAGFATFLTYATSFLAIAVAIAVAVEVRSLRQTLRLLGAAAAGGLAVLLVLRLALGFDLLACYRAHAYSRGTFYPYWMAGHPASVLLWAGLPLAALGVAGLIIRVPAARRPVLPLVLATLMLIWGMLPPAITDLRQGEVERTWSFLYPMLAAAAGPVIARWTDSTRLSRFWAGSVVFVLVILSVAQAGLLQALWDNML